MGPRSGPIEREGRDDRWSLSYAEQAFVQGIAEFVARQANRLTQLVTDAARWKRCRHEVQGPLLPVQSDGVGSVRPIA